MNTNPFITAHTSDEDVAELLKVGLPLMGVDGRIKWAAVETLTGIKYSRGWLILRHAYLAQNQPNLIVDVAKLVANDTKQATDQKRLNEYEPVRDTISPIVTSMRDIEGLSWGEIMVRTNGMGEGAVRKAYRATGGKKDLGLRVGKGGRFAYDEPTLYLENMKVQGAHISLDAKGRPVREQCLNFIPADAPVAKPKRAARKAKVA